MNDLIPLADVFAPGLCGCGCRRPTNLYRDSDKTMGRVGGQPAKFLRGHTRRTHFGPEVLFDFETGCWNWQHRLEAGDYGRVSVNGHPRAAYKVYYERARGVVPKGMCLDHLCRNTRCVNPAHLEVVTNAENVRRGNSAKITAAAAAAIRDSNESATKTALNFGISAGHVRDIRRGVKWA